MSRYANAHANPAGPGDARPTALKIVEDEDLIGKLPSKVFLVTGISSGIGRETFKALCATGAHVFGTARDIEKGNRVISEIRTSTIGGKATLLQMDNNSLASVQEAANALKRCTQKLNVIIFNAGVMATPKGSTSDGFEMQFGTNYLSHFYFFQLCKDLLLASSKPEFPSRVVSVSSTAHRLGTVRLHDYNFMEPDSYDPWVSYAQAKTANIWFANEIERRYSLRGLHATSVHPGGVATGLQVHVDKETVNSWFADPATARVMKSPQQGAATQVYAALSKDCATIGGVYLSDCMEQQCIKKDGDPRSEGYAAHAFDEVGQKQLWMDSLEMVGLQDEGDIGRN